MKIFNTKLLALVTSALLLGACSQMASYDNEDLTLGLDKADQSGFKLNPYVSNGGENAFITYEYEGDYFSYSEQDACIDEAMTVRFDIGQRGIDCGTVRIDIWRPSDGEWVPNIIPDGEPIDGYYEFEFTPEELGEIKFRGTYSRIKIDGTWCGTNITGFTGLDDDYLTVIECSDCDEASFYYETEDQQNIEFFYNHGSDVESVTLEFTFPQVLNMPLNEEGKYEAPDGKTYDVNNPTNQTVFTWSGEVGCDADNPESFVFSMTPDCSSPPANDGQANIWTDTKVVAINGVALVDVPETLDIDEGPYSLKGDLDNIVFEGCPVND